MSRPPSVVFSVGPVFALGDPPLCVSDRGGGGQETMGNCLVTPPKLNHSHPLPYLACLEFVGRTPPFTPETVVTPGYIKP